MTCTRRYVFDTKKIVKCNVYENLNIIKAMQMNKIKSINMELFMECR